MQYMIELLERLYNLTYVSTGEDGVHLFTCNDCGKEYRIQVISPASMQQERQSVPEAFYEAFESETLRGETMSDYEDNALPDDETEEEPTRRLRRRTFKKFDVMLAECEGYVEAGKRLPKLHSRWLYREFRQCHGDMLASIEPHNRMVDELRTAQTTIYKLQRRIDELEEREE